MSTAFPLAEPVQGSLFDTGIDFSSLRLVEEDLMGARLAANTVKSYAQAWGVWAGWCVEAGRDPLAATPETLCAFVSWSLSDHGWRLASVHIALAAIRHRCREAGVLPPVTDRVRALLRAAARRRREKPGGRAALSVEQLVKICSVDPVRPIEVRNRALILLGFASGMRRSELVALDVRDVGFCRQGMTVLRGVSKTDQVGKGLQIGIPPGGVDKTCPVKALRAWLRVRGNFAGPLFVRVGPSGLIWDRRLSGPVVSRVLKECLEWSGFDSSAYAAHSLRAGFVTAAAESGASEIGIMRRTGHTSFATVQRYVRPARAFACDPLAGVL